MADEPLDPLFDCSEPALSNRIARFQRRCQESPADRAAQALALAVDDLNSAMHRASTPEEFAFVRQLADSTIRNLIVTISVAETLELYL